MKSKSGSGFFLRYLVRGLIWLSVFIILFIFLKDNAYIQNLDWLTSLSSQEWLMYLIFGLSEVIFGIIPPEFFMIWSIHNGISDSYVTNVIFLAVVSYGAGISGYFIGKWFSKTGMFATILGKLLYRYQAPFRRYSGFILFVGAVTPLPFSAMCMLVGTVNYPLNKFFIITLTRFLRFIIYGYLVWTVNGI